MTLKRELPGARDVFGRKQRQSSEGLTATPHPGSRGRALTPSVRVLGDST